MGLLRARPAKMPVIATLAGAALAAAGCGGSSSNSGTASSGSGGGTVKVAAINWAEGPVKDLGDAENNGIQLAFDEQNAKGGVLGKKLKLTRYDEGYAADTFIPSARKAIADGNVALIGGQEVAACSAIVQVARSKNIPVIASVCGSAGDTMNGYTRSILMRVPGEGGLTALGNYIVSKGYKKVQFLGADTAFDRLTIKMFGQAFKKANAEIRFENPIFAPFTSANNRVQITKAVAGKPDLLYLGIFGHDIVVNGIKDARAAGYKGPIIINEAAFLQPEADSLGADGNNVYGSTGWVLDPNNPGAVKFADAFKAKFGKDADWLAENGYASANALIAAMSLAKSTDPEKFGPQLRKIKIQTVNGDPVTIGADGNRNAKNWYLLEDKNGKIGLGATLPLTCQASC
jgi:branched-chain amino acid transport system substrate-binding protein